MRFLVNCTEVSLFNGEAVKMLLTPEKYTLVAGAAEGVTELNAFDNALRTAGIGNLNLIKVSSILPPDTRCVERLDIPPGSLTPTAYGSIVSEEPKELISAAVGVGLSRDSFGIIMEYSGHCSSKDAEEKVSFMAAEAFRQRGIHLEKVLVKSVEHQVENIGCAFAAVALWY